MLRGPNLDEQEPHVMNLISPGRNDKPFTARWSIFHSNFQANWGIATERLRKPKQDGKMRQISVHVEIQLHIIATHVSLIDL
jgi:hypothetical protein